MTQRQSEAIVLRSWPFEEADLLVSLLTREQGRIKGVARHAMRSRRRFGGALEPMTCVRASYAEKPKQELVRLDAFEILWSPLSDPVDYGRTAALEFVAEVLEEVLPEQAPDDAMFRLAVAVVPEMQIGRIWLPVTYFALWILRLMGWMPALNHCATCAVDLRGRTVWYSESADGVVCDEDRRANSHALAAASVREAQRIFRSTIAELNAEDWPKRRSEDLRQFALTMLERHLERRVRSGRALERIQG
ncbi:DNA repair protein RecO [Edaphobacter sp. 12200R-103]|uniref:DNA repair protein RecO n=1 Tax=Edaphobacter sp. 12200R-103 TaxID=2703788 RepID=UPI00138D1885|nr:DNA repair protein RecO [Edaphobacter sp. 12200R-103]QHS51324.1 DNA repair protein RecO [Edaphobacter sp. 12200R-103]